jgi:hypothetical protein
MVGFEPAADAIRAVVIALFMSTILPGAVVADTEAEDAKLAQCAKDLCAILVSKKAKGPDLNCDLAKTWENDQIQKGADSKNLVWGFGSARCTAKVKAKRSELIAAVTAPEITFKFDRQLFACEIGTERYELSATIAPELKFREGSTTAVALHMANIQGAPLIKGVVWTAATLEENFGILQNDMIREVNRFIKKECPKILSGAK